MHSYAGMAVPNSAGTAQQCHVSSPLAYETLSSGFPSQQARHAASSAQAGLVTSAVTQEIKALQLLILALMRGT